MKSYLSISIHEEGMFVRILGYGVCIEMDWPEQFSERYGYAKVYRIGRLSLRFLKP